MQASQCDPARAGDAVTHVGSRAVIQACGQSASQAVSQADSETARPACAPSVTQRGRQECSPVQRVVAHDAAPCSAQAQPGTQLLCSVHGGRCTEGTGGSGSVDSGQPCTVEAAEQLCRELWVALASQHDVGEAKRLMGEGGGAFFAPRSDMVVQAGDG